MMIKLTGSNNKASLYIDHSLILVVDRQKDNPLQTLITTGIMGPQGHCVYGVMETLEEVAEAKNAAIRETAAISAGYPGASSLIKH